MEEIESKFIWYYEVYFMSLRKKNFLNEADNN